MEDEEQMLKFVLNSRQIISQALSRHLIGFALLVKYNSEPNRVEPWLLGSGVLIEINGQKGILTAIHVFDKIIEAGYAGLVLSRKTHNPYIESENLKYVVIDNVDDEGRQADIVFIFLESLSEEQIQIIYQEKTFFNCTNLLSEIENQQLASSTESYQLFLQANATTHDVLAITGFIGVYTKLDSPTERYKVVVNFKGVDGIAILDDAFISGDLDYIIVEANYDADSLPSSFKGASGGGLWKIYSPQPSVISMEDLKYTLYGLVVQESEKRSNSRRLISLGPFTIKSMCEKIIKSSLKP